MSGRPLDPSTRPRAQDRLRTHVEALVGERHHVSSPAALHRAQRYLAEQFRGLGVAVSTHDVEAFGRTFQNVVATLPASASPIQHSSFSVPHVLPLLPPLLIGAHYDTVPGSPGADDNASGLAVLLEAARSLRDVPLARAVRLIGFCLEEESLLGSLAYAASLRERCEDIQGAIVLECVGYCRREAGSQVVPAGLPIAVPSVGDFLGIVGNARSAEFAAGIEAAARRRVPDLKTVPLLVPGKGELLPDARRSDHAAFWEHGYPAVMLTDTANFRNPHYHRPTDAVETLDFEFLAAVAEAVTAAACELAGPPPLKNFADL
ncbi:MAG: M20/M25/M40 family metallo-hydrolase [Nitrospirota bacterium]